MSVLILCHVAEVILIVAASCICFHECRKCIYPSYYSDDGLSSNMEHKFSDQYSESALPVADKGSFVKPIPKGDADIFPARKVWSHPSVVGPAAGAKAHPVSAVEGFDKPATKAVVQKNTFPPRAVSEGSQQEGTVKILTAAIIELPDVEGAGKEGCSKMASGENPAKPKDPKLAPGGGKNRNHRGRRAAGKLRKCNYILTLINFK